MALSIKNRKADRLARELAELTGETLTDAVTNALRERLERWQRRSRKGRRSLSEELLEIGRRCSRLDVLDDREASLILAYDDNGLPD